MLCYYKGYTDLELTPPFFSEISSFKGFFAFNLFVIYLKIIITIPISNTTNEPNIPISI
jgi:hypothetical protein